MSYNQFNIKTTDFQSQTAKFNVSWVSLVKPIHY